MGGGEKGKDKDELADNRCTGRNICSRVCR